MAVDFEDIQGDQHVYGSEGERIGSVGAIVSDTETGERYLKVDRGGILSLAADDLYVPRDAIQRIDMGQQAVILKMTRDEAIARFSKPPGPVE